MSLAQEYCANLLASTDSFQSLVDVSTVADALDSIYHEDLPDPADNGIYTRNELEEYRPYALIRSGEGPAFERIAVASASGGAQSFDQAGTFEIKLIRSVPPRLLDHKAAADQEWKNIVGLILDQMCANGGTNHTYLSPSRVTVQQAIWRNRLDEVDDIGEYQGAILEVEF